MLRIQRGLCADNIRNGCKGSPFSDMIDNGISTYLPSLICIALPLTYSITSHSTSVKNALLGFYGFYAMLAIIFMLSENLSTQQ